MLIACNTYYNRMPRRRFDIDVSTYDGSQASVVKMSFQAKFPITTRKLNKKTLIPTVETLRENTEAEQGKLRLLIADVSSSGETKLEARFGKG